MIMCHDLGKCCVFAPRDGENRRRQISKPIYRSIYEHSTTFHCAVRSASTQ